jgi:hypothetical protein
MIKRSLRSSFFSEFLALAFGVLLIMIDFGDSHLMWNVGNLDIIFGLAYWKVFDVLLPFLSVLVFLLYGKFKGGFRFNMLGMLALVSYLVVLGLITLDDIAIVLNFRVYLTINYWIIIEWMYPFVGLVAFFFFGRANQLREEKTRV